MTDEQNRGIDPANAAETSTGAPGTGGASDTGVGATGDTAASTTAFDPDAAANADLIEAAANANTGDDSTDDGGRTSGPVADAGDPAPEQGRQRAAAAGPGESVNDGQRDAVGPLGDTSGSPLTRAAGAVGRLVDQTRGALDEGPARGWLDKLSETYRRRPGVVIGVGAAALFALAAVTRRRR